MERRAETVVQMAVFVVALHVVLAGCNPQMVATTAVKETYGTATDERSLSTQATDTESEPQIKAALAASPVRGTRGSMSSAARVSSSWRGDTGLDRWP